MQVSMHNWMRAEPLAVTLKREAKRVLLEDHTRECIACRRALTAARQGYSVAVQAGVNVQLWRGIHLAVLGEEMFTSFYSQAFRVFGALTADWTLRVGR